MSTGLPAGAYPIVPPLPEHETQVTTPDTTTITGGTEGKRLTPEQAAAIERTEAANQEAIQGTDEVAKHKAALATVERDMADMANKEAEAHQGRLNTAIDQGGKLLEAARNTYLQKQARLDAMPSPSFFADGDTWGNVKKGIGLALSGLGDAMMQRASILSGHGPMQLNSPAQLVERDLQQQRDHIMRLKDDVVTARTGIGDAEAARRDLLSDVDLKGAAALKRIEALTRARLAAAGLDQAAIDQHQAIIALKQGQAKYQQDYLAPTFEAVKKGFEHHTGTTTQTTDRLSSKNATGTESQAKTAELSAGMLHELNTIDSLPTLSQEALSKVQNNLTAVHAADQAKGLSGVVGVKVGRALGVIPPTQYGGLKPAEQKAMNAWDELVQLRLRQLSGAGIKDEEELSAARRLGYAPGDTPEVMKQKIARLRDAANRGLQLSGPAGATVSPGQSMPAQPTQPGAFTPSAPSGGGPALPPEAQHTLNWVNSPESRQNPLARAQAVRQLNALGVQVQ